MRANLRSGDDGAKHVATGYDHLLFLLGVNTKGAVLFFGLFHGFGLATQVQDFALPRAGLVAKIVAFTVAVEAGQFLAMGPS
ncbi:MAG: HupE/UreJ family protein [Vicinamibacterales bacterium]